MLPLTTTSVEQFDSESGLIWSKVNDYKIEVSLPRYSSVEPSVIVAPGVLQRQEYWRGSTVNHK